MGSHQSKHSSKDGKHNSADLKTPLTSHAPRFSVPHSPDPIQKDTFATTRSQRAVAEQPQRNHDPDIIEIDEEEGHSNVTRPPPPPRLRRLSELIDPHELTIDSHVRSPSGNLLAVEQFIVHPDRPRSMRERQEQIREKVRAASRLGPEVENVEDEKSPVQTKESTETTKRWKRGLRGCFRKS